MNKKLIRIIVSSVLLSICAFIEHTQHLPVWQLLILYLVPFLVAGYDVIAEALEGIMEGEPFNEDFLMCVATIGALFIGFLPGAETEFAEAVFVMLFFQIGELFEDYAEDKSRDSILELMNINPDVAHVMQDGQLTTCSPEQVNVGDVIVIQPGEMVPLDGKIIEGRSSLNTAALTGESLPREVDLGDEVISGCINLSGVLQVKVLKQYGQSTAQKIINLVENASERKSKSETFIARFAHVYTPIVVFAAIALAFIPPIFFGHFAESFPAWLGRALTFLVVSCPCALVISVPLTFFAGIGGASRQGVLIKGGNYMDTLAKLRMVVFDKTGTLTEGKFSVTDIHPEKISKDELLHLAAHVERYSTHPIAQSLRLAYGHEDDNCEVSEVEEMAGHGVRACINGKQVCVGNRKMLDDMGIKIDTCKRCIDQVATEVHVVIDGEYAGHILVADLVKKDTVEAIQMLKKAGIDRLVMLTGDKENVAKQVADSIGMDEYHAELLPVDKVKIVEKLLNHSSVEHRGTLAFVGDGINDAPVLARADVGIAMGALGSDAAIEAADVVLMDDKPSKIETAIRIARRTIGIARQNVGFAIGVKIAVLILAAVGVATMWMAVFADVGVMVLAVLNAMRAMKK